MHASLLLRAARSGGPSVRHLSVLVSHAARRSVVSQPSHTLCFSRIAPLNVRTFNSTQSTIGEVSREDLIAMMKEGTTVVVDVRGEDEVHATGSLVAGDNTALNIPLPLIFEGVLGMPDEEFEEKFDFSKPLPSQHVVFSCKAGVRSLQACTVAAEVHGYARVDNYKGSADEWFSYPPPS